MESPILTMRELCAWLRVNKSTIYRYVKANKLPHWRVGSDYRFTRSSIEAWMTKQEQEGG